MTASDILKKKYPKEIVAKSIESYKEIESNFAIKKWKPSELDSGHFVEAVRRLLEFELTGSYTPINKKLSNFTDSILKQYEQAQGNESYRMLIPRALKSIYNIRNKRGVGHISGVSPNEMDATYILYTVKWILAELVRLNSKLSIPETQLIVDKIVERKIEILWKEGNITRILKTSIKAENQILILLYDQSDLSPENCATCN